MKKISARNKVLQFKIVLNDSSPRIWRRILVPVNYTFFDLHCAIQDAMGWEGDHLHAFYIGGRMAMDRIVIEFPDPENTYGQNEEARDERKEKIADYFDKTVRQCIYRYDFGDNWDHTVIFERELSRDENQTYPQCIVGKNACPPDDCGGVWGYANLQEILKNSNQEEHNEILGWLYIDSPDEFDPQEFDPKEVRFKNSKKCLASWNKGFFGF